MEPESQCCKPVLTLYGKQQAQADKLKVVGASCDLRKSLHVCWSCTVCRREHLGCHNHRQPLTCTSTRKTQAGSRLGAHTITKSVSTQAPHIHVGDTDTVSTFNLLLQLS